MTDQDHTEGQPRPEAAIVPTGDGAITSKRSVTLVLARSALLAGLCRFVPIPLLDDYLERNVHRFMIASLLKTEGRDYHVSRLEALYTGVSGLFDGCAGWLIWLPITLVFKLLKKLFKSVFVVMLIREAGLSMGQALLLGHTVHRGLRSGAFQDDGDPNAKALLAEATLYREAFDSAFAGTDVRFLGHLLGRVFLEVKSLRRVGARTVRKMFGRDYTTDETPGEVPEGAQSAIHQGVEEVQEALEGEQVKHFIDEFDETFDAALRRQIDQHQAEDDRPSLPPAA